MVAEGSTKNKNIQSTLNSTNLIVQGDVGSGSSGRGLSGGRVAVPLNLVVGESPLLLSHLHADGGFLGSLFADTENVGTTLGKLLQAALDGLTWSEHLPGKNIP